MTAQSRGPIDSRAPPQDAQEVPIRVALLALQTGALLEPCPAFPEELEYLRRVIQVCQLSQKTMQRASRLKRELHLLATEPPPGITCWQNANQMDDLRAQILGGTNTPYEKGIFKLEVSIPERYPFEPPKIRFLTPIYHPNIDSAGRICLDVLKLPPKGAWRPSLNISTVLTSIQLLMAEPNPDDPLMADISSEFKYNKPTFLKNAREWTEKHARQRQEAKENEEVENLPEPSNPRVAEVPQKRKGSKLGGPEKRLCPDV